ncbi:MAG: hypothetical protein N2376_14970 [Clostridia bacterium]|nr:hypothetical protein [Clostridia bacterium]
MRNCIEEREFNLFLEDGLSHEDMRSMIDHAQTCAACREQLEGWKSLKATLDAASEIEIPPTLKVRVMEGVAKEKILPLLKPMGFRRTLAACVLVLLVAGYFLLPAVWPYIGSFVNDGILYLSTAFYNGLSFVGLDMKAVMGVFRVVVDIFNQYFWVFATSTLLLIVGFCSLILLGNKKLKAN